MRRPISPTIVTPASVWSPGKPLPMSCSRAPTRRRSGRSHRRRQRGGLGGRLEQVPVDGEAVVGVALGPVAHRRPLRDQPDEQAPLVEGLERGDGRGAGGEDPHERPPAWPRATGLAARRRLGQGVEGAPADGEPRARRPRRPPAGPGRDRRSGSVAGTEDDLAPLRAVPATSSRAIPDSTGSSATAASWATASPAARRHHRRRACSRATSNGGARRRRSPRRWSVPLRRSPPSGRRRRRSRGPRPPGPVPGAAAGRWRGRWSGAAPPVPRSAWPGARTTTTGRPVRPRPARPARRRARRGSRAGLRGLLSGPARAGRRRRRGLGGAPRPGRPAPAAIGRPRVRHWAEGLVEHGLRHRTVAGHEAAVEQSELGPQVLSGDLENLARGGARNGRAGCPRPTPGTRRRRRPDGCRAAARGRGPRRDRCRGTARPARIRPRPRGPSPVGSPSVARSSRPASHWSAAAENAVQKASPCRSVRSSSSWRSERRDTGDGSTQGLSFRCLAPAARPVGTRDGRSVEGGNPGSRSRRRVT